MGGPALHPGGTAAQIGHLRLRRMLERRALARRHGAGGRCMSYGHGAGTQAERRVSRRSIDRYFAQTPAMVHVKLGR